jgi:hypothetical protein
MGFKVQAGNPHYPNKYTISRRISSSSSLVSTPLHEERKLLSDEWVAVNGIRPDTLIKQLGLNSVDLDEDGY